MKKRSAILLFVPKIRGKRFRNAVPWNSFLKLCGSAYLHLKANLRFFLLALNNHLPENKILVMEVFIEDNPFMILSFAKVIQE